VNCVIVNELTLVNNYRNGDNYKKIENFLVKRRRGVSRGLERGRMQGDERRNVGHGRIPDLGVGATAQERRLGDLQIGIHFSAKTWRTYSGV
jgi:hypothetical protein